MHAAPPAPQLVAVGGETQVAPLQQPLGQLAALQTQTPPTQRWPTTHIPFAPQRQPPPVHESARAGSHATHAAPLVPHWPSDGVAQVPPVQQPLAQVAAEQPSQAWLEHVEAQVEQAAPIRPHCAAVVPAWQRPMASQQPDGQLVASQTHAPPEHRWPIWQAAPAPHAQAPEVQRSDLASHAAQLMPDAPHAVVDCAAALTQVLPEQQPVAQLAAVQVQVPLAQTCPGAHAAPVPQRHAPVVQALVAPVQAAHAAPPVPQAAAVCAAC